ncbi:TetR/AcrR family transcriptional regulator C-terminal domain-containing protein [Metabacillus sp. 22489]|uniref:TetR/AcrR family transcriptional regulator C-terminal domain-containing protein n=1 Tax=Metabacillus sp. 22489 TaxID=3453928 RepID=UPI003F850C02
MIKLSESVRLEGGIESNDIAKRIVTIIESVFQFLVQDPDLTRIGLFLSPNAKQIRNELTQIVKSNLEAEQRLGYFRYNLDMEIVAECIIGVIEHYTATYLLSGSKEPRILAQQIVDLFINGMLPKGDSIKTT